MDPSAVEFIGLLKDGRQKKFRSLESLLRIVANDGLAALMVARKIDAPALGNGADLWLERASTKNTTFIFLIRRKPSPRLVFREDGEIGSFICSGAVITTALRSGMPARRLAEPYHVFTKGALKTAGISFRGIQFPVAIEREEPPATGRDVEWIIPHAGRFSYLTDCLKTLSHLPTRGKQGSVSVGIDERKTITSARFTGRYSETRWFYSSHPHCGPYPIRNRLIEQSKRRFMLFQDSDDIPCADRLTVLRARAARGDLQMVGSHEIRVDDFEKRVIAFRYVGDVNFALQRGPAHALLHPTAMIARSAFLQAGGFSTSLRHSMDTQFLLRTHFAFCSGNVDEFLYIRRWRANSLCTHPRTALTSLSRAKPLMRWLRDFIQVRDGVRELDMSSLRVERRNTEGFRLHAAKPAPSKQDR